MMHSSLAGQMAFLIFAVVCAAAFATQLWWLRRLPGRRMRGMVCVLSAVLLALSWHLAEQAAARELRHIQSITQGFARLYADEMEKRGHAKLLDEFAAENPLYLGLIATEKSWLALNPAVNDIYTMRKRADGKNVFVVDSETDYNRNGRYDEQREQRTPPGEIYETEDAGLERAFLGQPNFDFDPVTDRWGTWVSAFVPLRDAAGRVEAVLGVDFDAHTFAAAVTQARLGVIGLMALVQMALLAASTLNAVLRARIAERHTAERLLRTAHEELEARVVERTAELTVANAELQLEIAQRRLGQQALAEMNTQFGLVTHKAGLAEVANSVLHNVGNVLNSLNVSVGVVSERLRTTPIADLPNVIALLRVHAADLGDYLTNDPTGCQVPGFLDMLAAHWATEHAELVGETRRLQGSVQHLKEIVGRQQSLSRISGTLEEIHLPPVIEEALAIGGDALDKSHVVVRRDFAATPCVLGDPVKLTQILVNLITNAGQSLAETDGTERQITVRTVAHDDGGVAIHVIDNGRGIAPEVHERLFTYGFTTKKDGHGFGLHASALAARDMGGVLRAESGGLARGATFIVELPAARLAVSEDLAA